MVTFRRSKKIGPLRITVTPSGVGLSIGEGPIRFSRSPKGTISRTLRIPGTGIYDTRRVGRRRPRA